MKDGVFRLLPSKWYTLSKFSQLLCKIYNTRELDEIKRCDRLRAKTWLLFARLQENSCTSFSLSLKGLISLLGCRPSEIAIALLCFNGNNLGQFWLLWSWKKSLQTGLTIANHKILYQRDDFASVVEGKASQRYISSRVRHQRYVTIHHDVTFIKSKNR